MKGKYGRMNDNINEYEGKIWSSEWRILANDMAGQDLLARVKKNYHWTVYAVCFFALLN